MRARGSSSAGTVSLVALCFVAVLGIALASYLAVCSRAMNLSNRSFQAGLGRQLAELGLEEALRAFNHNDWSSWSNGPTAKWTRDPANRRATCTLTFPADKFGQGVTAVVKIRIDNYDAARRGATWDNSSTYRLNDLVGYNGQWYRSVQNANTGHSPGSLAWWVPAPIPWKWNSDTAYARYDVVCYNGTWYRCASSGERSVPSLFNANWEVVPTLALTWSSNTLFKTGSLVYSTGMARWYRCIADCTNIPPPNSTYWDDKTAALSLGWRATGGKDYQVNDVVYYGGKWWRCLRSYDTDSLGGHPGEDGMDDFWEDALDGSMFAWDGGVKYNLDDVVRYNGNWYRCLRAHTGRAPAANPDDWVGTPPDSAAWDPGRQYDPSDVVTYNGRWYLCLSGHNGEAPNPTASTSYWATTQDSAYAWSPTASNGTNDTRHYGGIWYRCLTANVGVSPNSASAWRALAAPVAYAEATLVLANSPPLVTQLRAAIAPAPLFPNALGASTTIDIAGGSAGTIDSYDGSLTAMTDTGYYSNRPYQPGGFAAVVAAAGTSPNETAVTIRNDTTVRGYVAAPSVAKTPFAPSVSLGKSVYLQGPLSPTSPRVDQTRLSRSVFVPQFATHPAPNLAAAFANDDFPKGMRLDDFSGPLNPSTSMNLGTPGAVTPSRYYFDGDLEISKDVDLATLNINGPVILSINGSLRLNRGGTLYLNGDASAEIHIAKQLRVSNGSNGIVNRAPNGTAPDPKRLIVICDTAGTAQQTYNDATNDFHGLIYMPNARNLQIGSSSGAGVQMFGALSARQITFGAEANFHYDTSLRYATFGGVDEPYAVTEWRVLPDGEGATME